MTPAQLQSLADRFCSILISHAAHGLATSSLEGMGEITLRDALIVAAAAEGAQSNKPWILRREITPGGWQESAVDLVVYRVGNQAAEYELGGVELKWWRHNDKSNASNRRRDLVKDFIRAASLYPLVEQFSFVALLSTAVSWTATTETEGDDAQAMKLLTEDEDVSVWNVTELSDSPAVRGSVRYLREKVPIPNIFHSKLLSNLELAFASGRTATARVWMLKKPQNTHFLSGTQIQDIIS